MSEAAHLEAARALYAAFRQGDIPQVIEGLADDVSIGFFDTRLPYGGIRHGHDGAVTFFTDLYAQVEYQDFDPYSFLADNETVVVMIGSKGLAKLTQRAFEQTDEVHVLSFRGGQICKARFHQDVGAMLSAFATAY